MEEFNVKVRSRVYCYVFCGRCVICGRGFETDESIIIKGFTNEDGLWDYDTYCRDCYNKKE